MPRYTATLYSIAPYKNINRANQTSKRTRIHEEKNNTNRRNKPQPINKDKHKELSMKKKKKKTEIM